jgi:hypothetical protein
VTFDVTAEDATRAMFSFLDLAVRHTDGAWARTTPSGARLVATLAPLATFNGVFTFDGEPTAHDLAEFASEAGRLPWGVFVRSDPSADLVRVAAKVGLTAVESSPVLVCPAGALPADPPNVEVERVTVSARAAYVDALSAGYEAPRDLFEELMSESLMSAPGVTSILVRVAGEPVATALGVLTEGLVGIYNVATIPVHRRRGYGRLATTAALRAGYAAGAFGSYLITSEMGQPLYESMGYRGVETWTYLTAESS